MYIFLFLFIISLIIGVLKSITDIFVALNKVNSDKNNNTLENLSEEQINALTDALKNYNNSSNSSNNNMNLNPTFLLNNNKTKKINKGIGIYFILGCMVAILLFHIL